jgi:hypothetical protein
VSTSMQRLLLHTTAHTDCGRGHPIPPMPESPRRTAVPLQLRECNVARPSRDRALFSDKDSPLLYTSSPLPLKRYASADLWQADLLTPTRCFAREVKAAVRRQ